jgi:TRAP-type mannitol/chloroaromatic compound transport system permease small subunit
MLMTVAIVFLLLQGISEFLKNLHVFLRGERP